jgi:hypothetical protein
MLNLGEELGFDPISEFFGLSDLFVSVEQDQCGTG